MKSCVVSVTITIKAMSDATLDKYRKLIEFHQIALNMKSESRAFFLNHSFS